MKRSIIYFLALALLVTIGSCKKKDYTMGDLTAPSDIVVTTTVVGQDATHPYGDGSGDVQISLTGKNVVSFKVAYDSASALEFVPNAKVTHTYSIEGVNSYRITVVAYGAGATATTVTKSVQVKSEFKPDPTIISALVGTGSKTWKVDKDIPAHFGVGPWSASSITPEWWSAGINEKVACCNCFYTASFTFSKDVNGAYNLTVATPDGAFTKTGDLAGGLPGIPSTGAEACYSYGGGTSPFSFVRSTSGIAASASTGAAIQLGGSNTFIGYGAVQKVYEIISITPTALYLRVRGTETGNAWYIKLKAV